MAGDSPSGDHEGKTEKGQRFHGNGSQQDVSLLARPSLLPQLPSAEFSRAGVHTSPPLSAAALACPTRRLDIFKAPRLALKQNPAVWTWPRGNRGHRFKMFSS